MTPVRGFARGKAVVLGGLAAGALLCFGTFFAGVAWLVTGWYFLEQRDGVARNGPAAVFVLGLLASSLIAGRFGLRVGRDWYHNGR
jgi:hypothetical protein